MTAEQMMISAFCFFVWSLSAGAILLMVAAWIWAVVTLVKTVWRVFCAG